MLISNAYAASGTVNDVMGFLPMIVIFVLFYFMLIRPQMKQAKQHKLMLEALKAGDEVATTGGIVGKVTKVSENFVSIEIAASTVVNVQKHTVQTLLPPGTLKSI
ncbi:preprotein translocase subunit YajC [Methylophilus aquaticus]|uniref:Sec translocon accessory complex subunit YajC n=1 Tax=Methylophilus aquaticus TaxID=1971610 RepID=A0ABT9JVJ4_9PROT|nr:preprotein translocase subunit YajC [Methylophilus aquaticus]MDP8568582.1 preprotein translocase subunit YajC [Methylophilus aquaticus]